MNILDIKSYCIYLYNSTAIPFNLMQGKSILLERPSSKNSLDFYQTYLPILNNSKYSISYHVTKDFIFFGRVTIQADSDIHLYLGPISHTPYSKETLMQFILECKLPFSKFDHAMDFFSGIPTLPLDRFLQTLCFVNYIFNREKLQLEDLIDIKAYRYLKPITEEYTESIYISKEEEAFHNTYAFEQHYLNLIESGDVHSLKKLLDQPITITPGIVANTSLRQLKNIFVACATLSTRASVKGGMDIEEAYQLSDVYIQQAEKLQIAESIYNLQYQMIFDFTQRVNSSHIPLGTSKLINECLCFVNKHANQTINVQDVANHVNKSRSFVSRSFKEEMGFSLSDYITRKKIEEAKSLLTYSDKSISEISNYLCFSSQSYFQNVFKKKTGMTPHKYRLKTSPSS